MSECIRCHRTLRNHYKSWHGLCLRAWYRHVIWLRRFDQPNFPVVPPSDLLPVFGEKEHEEWQRTALETEQRILKRGDVL